jgi:hypothetical protein
MLVRGAATLTHKQGAGLVVIGAGQQQQPLSHVLAGFARHCAMKHSFVHVYEVRSIYTCLQRYDMLHTRPMLALVPHGDMRHQGHPSKLTACHLNHLLHREPNLRTCLFNSTNVMHTRYLRVFRSGTSSAHVPHGNRPGSLDNVRASRLLLQNTRPPHASGRFRSPTTEVFCLPPIGSLEPPSHLPSPGGQRCMQSILE